MNVIARLEYELAYYDSAVHRFNHYTMRTSANAWLSLMVTGDVFITYDPFKTHVAQSAGAIEYTDCTSAEGLDPPHLVSLIWHKAIWWWGSIIGRSLGMPSTSSLPLLQGLLWLRVVAPDRVLFMGQIELDCQLNTKLNYLK